MRTGSSDCPDGTTLLGPWKPDGRITCGLKHGAHSLECFAPFHVHRILAGCDTQLDKELPPLHLALRSLSFPIFPAIGTSDDCLLSQPAIFYLFLVFAMFCSSFIFFLIQGILKHELPYKCYP